MATLVIRDERLGDEQIIRTLLTDAFRTAPFSAGTEAAIVDGLRAAGGLTISLVAEMGFDVLGHIAFSPVTIDGAPIGWFGLGPIAVRPDQQGRGIGQALVRAGLDRLKALGGRGVVLLGASGFYARFGFRTYPGLRLAGAPPEHFLALPFGPEPPSGSVEYDAAFK